MAKITREHAEAIAKKHGGTRIKGAKAHDQVLITFGNKLIAQFGIRRSSRKDIGHGHVPGALYVTPRYAWELGTCSKSKQQWLDQMGAKKLL